MGKEKSVLPNITCSVPQGSIMGPKLFILHINYIIKTFNILKFAIFADDTNAKCKTQRREPPTNVKDRLWRANQAKPGVRYK